MQLHYRVRNVLLSDGASAVTLTPGNWFRDSDTRDVEIDGETYPDSVPADPTDPGAEFWDDGSGKLTELRFSDETDLRPRDYVTITVELTK